MNLQRRLELFKAMLNRRRYWKGELSSDKIAAYQTLQECLDTVAKLMCSFSPFYADNLYRDLNFTSESIHLQDFPTANEDTINLQLEEQIKVSQRITSLILRIRRLNNLKVRQPLSKAIVPALSDEFAQNLQKVEDVIKSEVNVKEIEIISKDSDIIKKSAKPNFKVLGSKVGRDMKSVKVAIESFSNDEIGQIEKGGSVKIEVDQNSYSISSEDIEIKTADIPGWQIMSDADYTVALDLEVTAELKKEGVARELVNKIQNLRKEKDFEVTDKITVLIEQNDYTTEAIGAFNQYICGEILASSLSESNEISGSDTIDIDNNNIRINLTK